MIFLALASGGTMAGFMQLLMFIFRTVVIFNFVRFFYLPIFMLQLVIVPIIGLIAEFSGKSYGVLLIIGNLGTIVGMMIVGSVGNELTQMVFPNAALDEDEKQLWFKLCFFSAIANLVVFGLFEMTGKF